MYFYLFSQVHGQKAVWEDPVEWVRGTLPWPNAQQDQSKLFHLPPPSIGPPGEEKKPPKDTPPPSTLESDPLVRVKALCCMSPPLSLSVSLNKEKNNLKKKSGITENLHVWAHAICSLSSLTHSTSPSPPAT